MGPGDVWEWRHSRGRPCLDGTPLNWGDALAGLLVVGLLLYALLKDSPLVMKIRQWWEEWRK
jgi:hypothetical protein